MSRLVAVDPGKRSLAVAVFEGERLVAVHWITGRLRDLARGMALLSRPELAVVEVPQVYPHMRQQGDPNDLIDVAVSAGIAVGLLDGAEVVRPHAWKGTRPKAVCNRLTRRLLLPTEMEVLETCKIAEGKKHNVLDAVGIGLWRLGRR